MKNEKEVLLSATVVNTNTVDLALLKDPVADKKPEKTDTTSFTGIQAEKRYSHHNTGNRTRKACFV